MPLQNGKSEKAFRSNVGELINTAHDKGKIGNIIIKNGEQARKIALAIAYKKKRGQ
jgi:hypothetical protein